MNLSNADFVVCLADNKISVLAYISSAISLQFSATDESSAEARFASRLTIWTIDVWP